MECYDDLRVACIAGTFDFWISCDETEPDALLSMTWRSANKLTWFFLNF